MIDERTRAALARLTENERACLGRRLRHQTAKEMAIDLGISPHAVEKRLKMARTKLGVSSSLEAARLLEASERYGPAGPQTPDLGAGEAERQDSGDPVPSVPAWRRIMPYALAGAFAMSLAIVAFLAVVPLNAPPGGAVPPAPGGAVPLEQGGTVLISERPDAGPTSTSGTTTLKEFRRSRGMEDRPPPLVRTTPELVRQFVNETFDIADKDHSGFIERDEAPEQAIPVNPVEIKGRPDYSKGPPPDDENERLVVIKGTMGQAAYIALWDKDADGRASRQEYMDGNFEKFLAWGVPANWRGVSGNAQARKD